MDEKRLKELAAEAVQWGPKMGQHPPEWGQPGNPTPSERVLLVRAPSATKEQLESFNRARSYDPDARALDKLLR